MRRIIAGLLYVIPRLLAVLLVAPLSLYALMSGRLIEAAVLLGFLALAWRMGWIGGLIFLGRAAIPLFYGWPKGKFSWDVYLNREGPMIAAGLLFLLDWWYARVRER